MTTFTVAEVPKLKRLLSGAGLEPRGSFGFNALVLVSVAMVGAAAMVALFPAQVRLGRLAQLAEEAAVALPFVIDGPIVVFTLVGMLRRSRGKSIWLARLVVGLFTLISMVVNVLHGLITPLTNGDPLTLIHAVNAFLSMLMPISIWLVTHTLLDLLVEKPRLSPEEIRAEILREVDAEKEERARVAEAQRLARLEEEELGRQREKEAADLARWEEIKDSPQVSVSGSPERQFFKEQILSTYKETGNNMSRTAEILGVAFHQVRQVIKKTNEPEFDTSR